MKQPLRLYWRSLLSLYLVSLINTGFTIGGGLVVFLYAALLLSIINMFVKPVLKILFMPINLITLGFFSWVINLAALYLLTRIVPQTNITSWQFAGLETPFFVLPPLYLSQSVNFFLVAVWLSFFERFFHWLEK